MCTCVAPTVACFGVRFRLALILAMLMVASGCSCRAEPGVPESTASHASGQSEHQTPKHETPDPSVPDPSAPEHAPLAVAVVDDPDLATAIRKQWAAISEQPLELRELTTEALAAGEFGAAVDVWIYPTAWLGTLVESRVVGPVPDDVWNGRALDRRAILGLTRKVECIWGEAPYAVPLGAPVVSLVYRADVFERLGLQPPRTWTDYQALADKLSDRTALGDLAPPNADAWVGSLEPLKPGWAGAMLLVRAAAYSRHRNQYSTLFDFSTMQPLIDGPPYVRALEELVAAAGANPGVPLEMDVSAVRNEIMAGRAAMGIVWPGRTDESSRSVALGVAPLPGATQVFNAGRDGWEMRGEDEPLGVPVFGLSGRLGSISRGTARARSAANFLTLVVNADWSVGVLSASADTGPSRSSHLKGLSRWLGHMWEGEPIRQYAQVIETAHDAPTWLVALRIPGRDEYMATLDDAVRAAVRSESTPQEALTAAAGKWRTITARLGQDKQRTAYRRSLGLAK